MRTVFVVHRKAGGLAIRLAGQRTEQNIAGTGAGDLEFRFGR